MAPVNGSHSIDTSTDDASKNGFVAKNEPMKQRKIHSFTNYLSESISVRTESIMDCTTVGVSGNADHAERGIL